jgi:hypothetical protein
MQKENENICTSALIAVFFTIPRLWTQAKCLSTDEGIMKMFCIWTMKYYSKTFGILSFVTM